MHVPWMPTPNSLRPIRREMLALGAKVDRLEKQIEQIAEHLHLKLRDIWV